MSSISVKLFKKKSWGTVKNELGSEQDNQVHSLQQAKKRLFIFHHQPLMVWGQFNCKLTSKRTNHTTDGTFVETLQERGRGEKEKDRKQIHSNAKNY